MKTLQKLSIAAMFLLMSGCAHYGGYYSDFGGGSVYGVHVDGYVPYNPYSIYYERRIHKHRPFSNKHGYDRFYGHGRQHKHRHWKDRGRHEKHWQRRRYGDYHHHHKKRFGHDREFRRWSDKRRYRDREYGRFPRSENRLRKHRHGWGDKRSGFWRDW